MLESLVKNNFSEKRYLNFLKEIFNIEIKKAETKKAPNNEYIEEYQELGVMEINDIDEVGFFTIKSLTPNIENIRIGFNKFVGSLINKYSYDGLIVAIYHPNSDVWRLSYVALELNENRELLTHPKRYTFELGDVPTATAENQLKLLNKNNTLEEIKEAFSVEKVSNEFFKEYKEQYFKLTNYLEEQNIEIQKSEINLFSKKLLGRIIFLYFLQKKGWIGVEKNEEWSTGDKQFLKTLFTKEYKDKKTDFYSDILKPIFFEALNVDRKESDYYFEKLNCRMPFLNGGLFNEDDVDEKILVIENHIFKDIFKVFNNYNFTIIEDTPHDSEVAIDPEMLGRVFEDLLEDRKDKGAFYTPREIVHYMCQQSIINYLSNSFKDKKSLENLVLYHQSDNEFIKNNADKIYDLLTNIKVLDPAIGSGAFPMGMLHEIVLLLEIVFKVTNKAIEIQSEIDNAYERLKEPITFKDKRDIQRQILSYYEKLSINFKRQVIQNSIYGIDIEPSAVEIAKLRFWLSIVVDEKKPEALPNLFYKIMVGNSLVETIDNIDPLKGKTKKSLHELDNLFKKYYKEHKDKNDAKNKISIKLTKLFKSLLDSYSNQLVLSGTEKELKKNKKETITAKEITTILKELQSNHFSDKLFLYKLFFKDILKNDGSGGFDVIIGNPPYLRVQGIDKKTSEQYKKLFDSATGSYDLYVLFTEKALELLSKNGIVNYIMPHKWINASFGKGLRTIAKDKVSKFISFGAYQVFNASTYTSLVWLQNNKQTKYLKYVELDRDLTTNQELEKYLTKLDDDSYTKINNKDLTSDNWIFTNKKTYKILEKLKQQPLKISDIFEKIFQGLATSKDSVYFLKDCRYKDDLVTAYSDELQKKILIEKELVKPLLKGDDVHRYDEITTDKVVVFPYYIELGEDKEKAILYTEDEIKNKFPNGYKYLKECESILRAREKGRFNIDGEWFQYGRKQGILNAQKEKLIQPDISLGGNFSYDKNGEFYQTTTLYGYKKFDTVKESYKFYMAILNSKLLWWYLTQTGTTLANGYFRFKPNYLNPFPMPKIENIEDTKPFEILVDEIMSLKELGKDTQKLEDKIDGMVYELYGLSYDEIAVIERGN